MDARLLSFQLALLRADLHPCSSLTNGWQSISILLIFTLIIKISMVFNLLRCFELYVMFTVFVYLINVLLVERRCINNAKVMLVVPSFNFT